MFAAMVVGQSLSDKDIAITKLQEYKAGKPMIEIKDTIKKCHINYETETVDFCMVWFSYNESGVMHKASTLTNESNTKIMDDKAIQDKIASMDVKREFYYEVK